MKNKKKNVFQQNIFQKSTKSIYDLFVIKIML